MPTLTRQPAEADAPAPQPAETVRCLICGGTTCDRWHPEVTAWYEGWKAVETVLARMEASKVGRPDTKQAA
jgi:hypothetical protein